MFKACNGMKQSPIDITFSGSSPTTISEPSPITFTNYDKVRLAKTLAKTLFDYTLGSSTSCSQLRTRL